MSCRKPIGAVAVGDFGIPARFGIGPQARFDLFLRPVGGGQELQLPTGRVGRIAGRRRESKRAGWQQESSLRTSSSPAAPGIALAQTSVSNRLRNDPP